MKLYSHFTSPQNGERAKILFLHGMGGTGALWRPFHTALEQNCAVLSPDQRGHGQSQGPLSGFSPLDYGQDIIETIEAHQFYPAWIIGHSMGVRSAVATAHLKPQWTRGLILIDLGLRGGAGGGLNEKLAQLLKNVPSQFASRDEARAYMRAHTPDPSIGQYLMAVSVKGASGEVHFPFDRDALIQTLLQAREADLHGWIEDLAALQMPLLFLRGGKSKVWSLEDFTEEKERFKKYPHVQFITYEDAGHGLPFEKKDRFIQELQRFVGITLPLRPERRR